MTYPNRTFCDTVEEMRKLVKTMNVFTYSRNKALLISLIEECQTYGNRMEAALHYKYDLRELHKKKRKLEKEVKFLAETVGKDPEEATLVRLASRLLDEED